MYAVSAGDRVQRLCLHLAVNQGCSAPTAALLLTSWLMPPLYDSLHVSINARNCDCTI